VSATFTHKHLLTLGWIPGPGQRYGDAPKAECVVTRMTSTAVYYRYAATGGRFSMSRATWDRDYAKQTK
jgi:hypothetical protein